MKTKRLVFFSGIALVLFFVSFAIFSQLVVQDDEQLTQAAFVEALIKALGLEDQLGPAATTRDKAEYLKTLGYAPLGGWILENVLSKGDVAAVLGQVLGVEVSDDATADDYIKSLTALGIMTSGKADSPFLLDDLATAINTAAEMPGVAESLIQPYHVKMSPIK